MAACDQVRLLLGPFDDGELEPHEMEDVAFHVVSCKACKAALDDYRSLGVALRGCLAQPSIEGFAAAVLKRIDEIPQPLRVRWRRHFDTLKERVGTPLWLAAAGGFAALLTVWLASPYAQRWLHHSPNPAQIALLNRNGMDRKTEQIPGGVEPASPGQSDSSLITVYDPATTVIWLPDQP
jgi:Putative zinc-finger